NVVSDKNCKFRDSIEVKWLPEPKTDLGNDTTMCVPKTLLLAPETDGIHFLWQDNSTNATFLVNEPGLYHVNVTNAFGCSSSDTLEVYYLTPPTIELGNDTILCKG